MPHHYAIFSAHFAPHPGGIETFTAGLASQLAREGDSVEVVTMRLSDQDGEKEALEDGVRVWRLPCRPLMNGRLPITRKSARYRELMDELAAAGVDRVLVNARFYAHSVEALRFARRIGAPAVVLDHGTDYLTLGNPIEDLALVAYEHAMTAIDKRYHPTFAGISRASTRHLRRFGINTDIVINNAIDAEGFRSQASTRDFRHELGLGDAQRLVAFVGRLAPEKGALPLAQAADTLGSDFVVALAGDGAQRDDIERLALPNVHLLGALDRPDLSALLSQADCFCLPTRSEGFCTSLLESSAWGLPAVIPHVGGVDEILGIPPICGSLLPNLDSASIARAIIEAIDTSTPGRRQILAEHIADKCSWKQSTQALSEAYS